MEQSRVRVQALGSELARRRTVQENFLGQVHDIAHILDGLVHISPHFPFVNRFRACATSGGGGTPGSCLGTVCMALS